MINEIGYSNINEVFIKGWKASKYDILTIDGEEYFEVSLNGDYFILKNGDKINSARVEYIKFN